MKRWGVIVCLAAIAGAQVLAEEPLAFPEDAQRMSGARIVSGWEAEEGQIPWQLSVRMVSPTGAVSSCGGSIIHPEWGMTAAHCTATRVTMVLRAGAVSLWHPELLFETTEYYNHPLYIDALQSVVQPNDIALLKFPRAIPFSDRVQPIRLQRDVDRNRNYAGVRLEASGWGRTWTNGAAPDNLQWVYLTGESNLACWFAYGGSSIIVDSTICASHYNVTSQSTCQGDSGGPLVDLEEDGKYTMVGVASFVSGTGCHTDFPAGFIRPGHYHAWYREVTGLDFDWDFEEPTTVAPTTEADSSSSESSSSESSSEESEETTEAATTEAATTEAATTEEATTEAATTEAATTEAATTEAATTEEATTEAATTEAATTEESTTEAATTEAATTEAATTEEATTEAATTEAATTEAATTEEATTEAATTEAATTEAATTEEATTEAATTEAATTEAATTEEATTEAATTEAATTEEATTEAATTEEATTEAATTEEATTEAATTEAATTEVDTDEEDDTRSIFSYFRSSFARFQIA
ncbi:uncharacterized protein [Choristoneura fumiferana]|uniref:uncharacterized protein n=1 Tax=Choristoneura fumiferana TaxID=7141 RepID=UPI003D155952